MQRREPGLADAAKLAATHRRVGVVRPGGPPGENPVLQVLEDLVGVLHVLAALTSVSAGEGMMDGRARLASAVPAEAAPCGVRYAVDEEHDLPGLAVPHEACGRGILADDGDERPVVESQG